MIGTALEVTVLSFGLADRINRLNGELRLKKLALEETNNHLSEEVIERKRAQETVEQHQQVLVQSERLRVMGEVSASIAHEIRNAVTGVTVRTQQLRRIFGLETIDRSALEVTMSKLETSTNRVVKIVQSVNAMARNSISDEFVDNELSIVLDEALDLFRERAKMAGIELRIEIPPNGFCVHCRPTQISQVVMNLVSNAVDALSSGGVSEKWISVSANDSGNTFDIRVSNSGPSIPEHIRKKLFQPFYTTKEKGKGTGIGLTVSKTIVEQHHGRIYIDESKVLTTFVVCLPKTPANENLG